MLQLWVPSVQTLSQNTALVPSGDQTAQPVMIPLGGCGGASGAPPTDAGPNCGVPVISIGGAVDAGPGACVYTLQPPAAATLSIPPHVYLNQDGGITSVPEDTTHTVGWSYVDSSYTEIAIYGPACDTLQAGGTTLEVFYVCLI